MSPGLSLLLVEDNEDDVFLMMRALKSAGVQLPLQTAMDGQQAMEYLAGSGKYADRTAYPVPALIFLDIKLPHLSGLEVLRWLRAHPELRRIVVIVVTSSNQAADVRLAYELGANSYVVKPASFQQLSEFAQAFKLYWLSCNRVSA
jgi:CheY-like chemotaxis protein